MNGVLVDPSFSPDAIICRRPANISLAMIFDVTGKRSGTDLMSRRQRLGRGHAVKFFNRIFTNITVPAVDPPFLSRTFWPPIFTDNCPNMRSHFDRKLPYQRGLLLELEDSKKRVEAQLVREQKQFERLQFALKKSISDHAYMTSMDKLRARERAEWAAEREGLRRGGQGEGGE